MNTSKTSATLVVLAAAAMSGCERAPSDSQSPRTQDVKVALEIRQDSPSTNPTLVVTSNSAPCDSSMPVSDNCIAITGAKQDGARIFFSLQGSNAGCADRGRNDGRYELDKESFTVTPPGGDRSIRGKINADFRGGWKTGAINHAARPSGQGRIRSQFQEDGSLLVWNLYKAGEPPYSACYQITARSCVNWNSTIDLDPRIRNGGDAILVHICDEKP